MALLGLFCCLSQDVEARRRNDQQAIYVLEWRADFHRGNIGVNCSPQFAPVQARYCAGQHILDGDPFCGGFDASRVCQCFYEDRLDFI